MAADHFAAAEAPQAAPFALTEPLLPRPARVVVAYSGGLDSTVLLHRLAALPYPGLTAVHIDHGLQADARDWAEHCASACAALDIPFHEFKARIDPDDARGPEGAARAARYALLREALNDGDWLVTAHHRDDQAETVLLRLLRGTGVHGLAAIRPLTRFAPGFLWRPLLDVPKQALRDYAEAHGLRWIEDPHNSDARYARSALRKTLLPALRQHFPQADRSLARAAKLAAEAAELLDVLAEQDAAALRDADALLTTPLLAMGTARRHNVLRHWLAGQGFDLPDASTLDHADEELLRAPDDAVPLLRWPGCELRRFRDRLYAMSPLPALADDDDPQIWQHSLVLELAGGCGKLHASAPPPAVLKVRRARPGEQLRPAGHAHHRRYKNLFQEKGVPPWLRSRLPVIELAGEPACIAGVAVTEAWAAWQEQTGWKAEWQHGFRGVPTPVDL